MISLVFSLKQSAPDRHAFCIIYAAPIQIDYIFSGYSKHFINRGHQSGVIIFNHGSYICFDKSYYYSVHKYKSCYSTCLLQSGINNYVFLAT